MKGRKKILWIIYFAVTLLLNVFRMFVVRCSRKHLQSIHKFVGGGGGGGGGGRAGGFGSDTE